METASERYTKTCRWVLTLAHIQADEARATVITTEHMTAALAQETGCSAAKAMSRLGVDLESLERAMLQEEDKPPTWIQPEFDEMAEAAITTAGRTARLMGDPQIATQHLLLGILQAEETRAAEALWKLGLTHLSRASTKHTSGAEQKCTTREVIGQRKCPRQLFGRSVTEAGWQQAE